MCQFLHFLDDDSSIHAVFHMKTGIRRNLHYLHDIHEIAECSVSVMFCYTVTMSGMKIDNTLMMRIDHQYR